MDLNGVHNKKQQVLSFNQQYRKFLESDIKIWKYIKMTYVWHYYGGNIKFKKSSCVEIGGHVY